MSARAWLWGLTTLGQIRLTHDTAAAQPLSTIVIETIHSWTKAT